MGLFTNVVVFDDPAALADASARLVVDTLRSGRGHLMLGGGHSPRLTYRLVAEKTGPGDYDGAHIFFSDERMVPPDHRDSNYGMVRAHWLDPAGVPPAQVHRIAGELDPDRAAELAEKELRAVADPARIDLALLGLGSDGHTASLFPGSSALEETDRLFVAARGGSPANSRGTRGAPIGSRVTATLLLLAGAASIVFLVQGAQKAEAVRAALVEPRGTVPASLVGSPARPALWLLDRAAAALLP